MYFRKCFIATFIVVEALSVKRYFNIRSAHETQKSCREKTQRRAPRAPPAWMSRGLPGKSNDPLTQTRLSWWFASNATSESSMRMVLRNRIYGSNKFLDPCDQFKQDAGAASSSGFTSSPHTHLQQTLVTYLLRLTAAQFVVEVGSYLGGSTVRLGQGIREQAVRSGQPPAALVCIDPFVGDASQWSNFFGAPRLGKSLTPPRASKNVAHETYLFMRGGRPQIFGHWMRNVIFAKLENIVLPLATTSSVGLTTILRLQQVPGGADNWPLIPTMPVTRFGQQRMALVDLMYIDAGHEEDETAAELKLAWKVLRPGGVLFGDDFDRYWEGVRIAVMDFARRHADELAGQSDEALHSMPGAASWRQPVPGLVVDANASRGNQWIMFRRVGRRRRRRR